MKKLYSALVALLLITTIPAIAQKGLYFGIAGTVQNTWMTNQNNYGRSPLDTNRLLADPGTSILALISLTILELKLNLAMVNSDKNTKRQLPTQRSP